MLPTSRLLAARTAAAGTVLAAFLAAAPALALVDGTAPTLWKQHTVQGDAEFTGNTLLGQDSLAGGAINNVVLGPGETFAQITGLPADAQPVAAYVFWAGTLWPNTLHTPNQPDTQITMEFPDGALVPVTAEQCRRLARAQGGDAAAYYCRADVGALVRAHQATLPDGTRTPNGNYNVRNAEVAFGTPSFGGPAGSCDDPDDPCQAAFGAWAMALVWSAASAPTTRDVVIYDGFLRMDELCGGGDPDRYTCLYGSSGVSPPITLGGFTSVTRAARLSVFAMEGDRQLGSPTEPAENADFLKFDGVELGDVAAGTYPKNFYNSLIANRQGGTPFSGVDLKSFNVQLPPPSGFPPLIQSVLLQPGSGDGRPDHGYLWTSNRIETNGELVFLGTTMLSVETIAPNFKNSSKTVDKLAAGPGDTLTYTINVVNGGNWAANTTLRDALESTLEYVPGTTRLDGTPVADPGGQFPLASGLSLGMLVPVGGAGGAQVTFQARIKANVGPGQVCNTGLVDATYQIPGGPSITMPTVPVLTNPCTTIRLPNLQRPAKSVIVDGTAGHEAKPGSALRYTVSITNSGNQASAALTLTDDLPKFLRNFRVISVPFGARDRSRATGGANGTGQLLVENILVPANYTVSVIFDADVVDSAEFLRQGGTDGTSLPNTAVLSGPAVDPAKANSDDPTTSASPDPTTVVVRIGVDLAASAKTVAGDNVGIVTPGTLLTYTIRLTNSGSAPATAAIDDDLPANVVNCAVVSGPITCQPGGANGTGRIVGTGIAVGAGASRDVSFTVRVYDYAPDGATITNRATLTAAERPGVTWTVTSPTVTVRAQVVWSTSTKTVQDVNGGGAGPGDELLYTIVVRNSGNKRSGPVTVTDTPDPNTTFVSAGEGGRLQAGTIVWDSTTTPALADVAPGGTVTLTFRARINAAVPDGTIVSNVANIRSADARATTPPANIRVTNAPTFDQSTKAVSDVNGGTAEPGDELLYTVTVKNTGNWNSGPTTVSDTLDTNLVFVSAGQGGRFASGAVTWDRTTTPELADLAPGAIVTLTFRARIASGTVNGTVISNQAAVRAATVSFTTPPVSVTVSAIPLFTDSTKTVVDQTNPTPRPGDTLLWTVNVRNTGKGAGTDVVVTDTVDPNLTVTGIGQGGTQSGNVITWRIAKVDPGATSSVTFTATIRTPLRNGTTISNQAQVRSAEVPREVPTDDPLTPAVDDPTTIRVTSSVSLSTSTKVATDESGAPTLPGDRVTWRIRVVAQGDGIATGVAVTDSIDRCLTNIVPANGGLWDGTRIRWDATTTPALASVAPGTPVELAFSSTVTPGTPDGTLCPNQGALVSPDTGGVVTLTDDPATPAPNDRTIIVVVSKPVLDASTKAVQLLTDSNGDGAYSSRDRVRYSIIVKNTGSETATGVVVTDTLPPGSQLGSWTAGAGCAIAAGVATCNVGDVAAGSSRTLVLEASVALDQPNGTEVSNQARVVAGNVPGQVLTDDPATPAAGDPTKFTVRSYTILSATKTVRDLTGPRVSPGDLLEYTIVLRNSGDRQAANTVLRDALDPNLTFVSAGGVVPGTYDAATRTVTWQRLNLGHETTITYVLQARIALALDNGTRIANQASAAATEVPVPVLSDDPATPAPNDPTVVIVISGPDLSTSTKTYRDTNGGDVRPGDVVEYTITAKNTGNAFARTLRVTDPVDARLAVQTPIDQGGVLGTDNTVTWTLPEPLAPGAVLPLRLLARVRLPLPNGTTIANQASLSAQGVATPFLTDDPGTPAPGDPTRFVVRSAPVLAATKAARNLSGATEYRPGDTVRYTLALRNTGDADATSGVLTDVLDQNLEFVSASDGATWDANSRTVRWAFTTLGASPEARSVTLDARLKRPLPTGTVVANQGTLVTAETTPLLTDDPATSAVGDPTRITVTARPDLSRSTKAATDLDGGDLNPGDEVEFTIVVKNTGDTTATNVAAADVVDALLTDVTPLDGGAWEAPGRVVRWQLPRVELSPAGDRTLRFRARVAPLLPNGTVIANTAMLAAAEAPVSVPTNTVRLTVVSAPRLDTSTKTVVNEAGALVRPGDTLTWTLTVRNTGDTYATGIVVEDAIDPALTGVVPGQGGLYDAGRIRWDATTTPALGRLAPGGDGVVLSFRARIKDDVRNGTTIANQGSVSCAEDVRALTDDPGTPAPADPTKIDVRFPDLRSTTKTVADVNAGDVAPGDLLVWTIRLTNEGALPATNVRVEDPLDPVLVDVAPDGGGTVANGKITWTPAEVAALASLGPGQSVELKFLAKVKPLTRNGRIVSNQASVTAPELRVPVTTDADLATTDVREPTTVRVVAHPDLTTTTLTVADPNGEEARPGDALVWTITVRNTGNTVAASTVVKVDLPAELGDAAVDVGTVSGQSVTFDRASVPALAEVAPGTDVPLVIRTRVRTPMADGTVVSVQGFLTSEEIATPVPTDDPSTPVLGDPTRVTIFSRPRFTHSEKSATDLNGGKLEPGDEVLYEIVVLNDGTETAKGVRVFDTVPPGTTYVEGTASLNGEHLDDSAGFPLNNGLMVRSAHGTTPEGDVLVDDKRAPDDEAAVVQFRVKVDRTVLAGTVVSNQAIIAALKVPEAFTDDPKTPMQGDPTVLVVGGGASVAGTRLSWALDEDRGTPNVADPGDLVRVDIEIPNSGTVPLDCLTSTLAVDARLVPEGDLLLDGRVLTRGADADEGEWVVEGSTEAVVRPGLLEPRKRASIRVRARLADSAAGTVPLQARVRCPGRVQQLSDSDPSLPGDQPAFIPISGSSRPDLSPSTLTVEDLNGGSVRAGDKLRYTLSLVNSGGAAALDAALTSALPEGLVYVAGTLNGDCGFDLRGQIVDGVSTLTGTAGSLPAGLRCVVRFVGQVGAEAPAGWVLREKASVTWCEGAAGCAVEQRKSLDLQRDSVVGGISGAGALIGRVYEDLDDVAGYDPEADAAYGGFQVQLRARREGAGQPASTLRSSFSDEQGRYAVLDVPPGDYEVEFFAPDGAQWSAGRAAQLAAGETRVLDAQLRPTGVVYRSGDLTPVPGARAFLFYDSTMLGREPPACDEDRTPVAEALDPETGATLPRRPGEGCLGKGQQGQRALSTGAYLFDLDAVTDGAEPALFQIHVVPPSQLLSFPSTARPPAPGVLAPEETRPHRPARAPEAARWYLRIAQPREDELTTGNHVPLDPLEDSVRITKQASRSAVHVGEFVTYTVGLVNGSGRDLRVGTGAGLVLVDVLPQHLRYVRGSARALRRGPAGDACARVANEAAGVGCDEGKADPAGVFDGTGRVARFGPYDLKTGETLIVRYTLAVSGAAKPGDYVNSAHAEFEGVRVTRDAQALVRVLWDPLFEESTIVGKVFCDDDGNGLQTPGEPGVGAARVYADSGYYVEADVDGKFHFVGLRPGLHLFKLDARSLPPGSDAAKTLRQTLYLTPGLDLRVNFPVKCALETAKPQRVRLVRNAPPPEPPPAPKPVEPPPPAPIVVTGGLSPLELQVDGVPLRAPGGEARLLLDGSAFAAQNAPAPADGRPLELSFRVFSAPGPVSRAWALILLDEEGKELHRLSGAGSVPPVVAWDGRNAAGDIVAKAGGRYAQRLELDGGAGVRHLSPAYSFGIDWVDPKKGRPVPPAVPPVVKVVDGALFDAKGKPTPRLTAAVAEFVAALQKDAGRITVEVHADPSDGKGVRKLTEQRAATVQGVLVARGIAAERIERRARGAESPLTAPPPTPRGRKPDRKAIAAAQQANRRVVLIALPGAPPPAPPAAVPPPKLAEPAVSVAGNPVTPDDQGRFRVEVPRDAKGPIEARVTTGTGETLEARWVPGPRVAALPTGEVPVVVDVARARASIGSIDVALPLLAADAQLSNGGVVELGDAGPKEPLRFAVRMGGAASEWQLAFHDDKGAALHKFEGRGPPPTQLEWSGVEDGKLLVGAGSYSYQFSAADAAGNRVTSARHGALAWKPAPGVAEVIAAAQLFTKPDGALLKPGARKLLQAVAKKLEGTEGTIVVEGFSDSNETQKLTAERAQAVRAMLASLGVPTDRLTAVGRGGASPRVPNLDKKSRERNRRVEVRTAVKLPVIPAAPAATKVRIHGTEALALGDDQYRVILPAPPAGPVDIVLESADGRVVIQRVELPTPEAHEDRPGASRRVRARALLAQAGPDLPPLPDLEPIDEGTAAPAEPTAPAKKKDRKQVQGPERVDEFVMPPAEAPVRAPVEAKPAEKAAEPAPPPPPPPADDVIPLPPVPEALPAAPAAKVAPAPAPATPSRSAPALPQPPPAAAAPLLPPPPVPTLTTEERVGDKIILAMPADEAPPEIVALKLLATLPRDGAKLTSTRLAIRGSSDPRNEVKLGDEVLRLDETGVFRKVIDLPAGEHKLVLTAKDPDGNTSYIERTYRVEPQGLFVMGLADAELGGYGGETEGIDSLALKVGGRRRLFVGGRVAATASGELPISDKLGGFFKSLKLVANVDSTRRSDDAAFRDLYDTTRFYPVLGDGSTIVQEAPARGPVFARVDLDDSHVLFGDFRTGTGGSELMRYDRTLYGGELGFKRDWTPAKMRTDVQLMGAPGDDHVRHGHMELAATGGSVYYLKFGNVVEGTERVRIVVRDRDTGLELSRQERARHVDYVVGYVDGRLLFKQPVSATADPTFLINNNFSSILNGHPVFIVVDYEYRDLTGDQGGVLGGRLRQSFLGGLVSVGGGLVQEARGDADPYRLWGLELGTRKSDRTYATFEFARSQGADAASFFSKDGGQSYDPLGGRCLDGSLDPQCSANRNGFKFEGAAELAELLGRPGELLGARAWFQSFDPGFYMNGGLLEQGTTKYGAQVRWPITPKDAVLVRHDSVESMVDIDPATAGFQRSTIYRRLTGVQYRHTETTWGAVAEYANSITAQPVRGQDSTVVTDTILVGGQYKPIPALTLTLTQDGLVNADAKQFPSWNDRLTTTAGASYQLNEVLTATLAESIRWNGENATQIGLGTKLGGIASVYANERFQSRAGQLVSTTLVGGGVDVAKGMHAYGEYQLDDAMSGAQNRAVVGLNNRWAIRKGFTISAGYERSQLLGKILNPLSSTGVTGSGADATQGNILGVPPFATPGMNPTAAIMPGATSRDVATFGLEYLASPLFKASGRFETRFDNADPQFAALPGAADRLQLVFLSTVDWKWTNDVAFLTRVVYADTFRQDAAKKYTDLFAGSVLDSRYLEATAGFALRPVQYDWLAVLGKVGRVIDRRPLDLATGAADTQTADVVSVSPSFETPFGVGLAHKLAFKHVRSSVTGVPDSTSYVLLNVNRVDWHLLSWVDLSFEYRFKWTRAGPSEGAPAGADGEAPTPQGDLKHGAVVEAAYRPLPYLRVGFGWNFASFSDNELSRLDETQQGFFVRATGQF